MGWAVCSVLRRLRQAEGATLLAARATFFGARVICSLVRLIAPKDCGKARGTARLRCLWWFLGTVAY
jgi:hypothetical protein